ncbi:MAG: hypothetical protein HY885_09870 [Deltaproteobacteria bacterium]|nr:hypothetical protein [Deltaproteobacteria bacterium]
MTCDCLAQENNVGSAAMLRAHNSYREKVGSTDIQWSKALEAKAIKRVKVLKKKGCIMEHDGPGENLYWASALKTANKKNKFGAWIWKHAKQNITENDVVSAWASEKKWYSPAGNICLAPPDETCGHYTQLVWEKSTELGCAKAVCKDDSQVWLCLYAPPGNIIGQKPY